MYYQTIHWRTVKMAGKVIGHRGYSCKGKFLCCVVKQGGGWQGVIKDDGTLSPVKALSTECMIWCENKLCGGRVN